jgi:hypothetical protein
MANNPRYASGAGVVGLYYLKSLLGNGYKGILSGYKKINKMLGKKNWFMFFKKVDNKKENRRLAVFRLGSLLYLLLTPLQYTDM